MKIRHNRRIRIDDSFRYPVNPNNNSGTNSDIHSSAFVINRSIGGLALR